MTDVHLAEPQGQQAIDYDDSRSLSKSLMADRY